MLTAISRKSLQAVAVRIFGSEYAVSEREAVEGGVDMLEEPCVAVDRRAQVSPPLPHLPCCAQRTLSRAAQACCPSFSSVMACMTRRRRCWQQDNAKKRYYRLKAVLVRCLKKVAARPGAHPAGG